MEDRVKRARFNIPTADVDVLAWVDAQTSLSNSLRTLVRQCIAMTGITDVTCVPVGTAILPGGVAAAVPAAGPMPVRASVQRTEPISEPAPVSSPAPVRERSEEAEKIIKRAASHASHDVPPGPVPDGDGEQSDVDRLLAMVSPEQREAFLSARGGRRPGERSVNPPGLVEPSQPSPPAGSSGGRELPEDFAFGSNF